MTSRPVGPAHSLIPPKLCGGSSQTTELPELVIPASFRKTVRRKQAREAGAVVRCVHRLGENPRHPGLRTKKMQGQPDVWEARASRSERVTFHYDVEGRIVLRKNCSHDVLQNP
jgi:mRNA interferase RelE/StbE